MSRPYPKEVRERAVRLVLETRDEYKTEYQALRAIGAKLDVGVESLRQWVRQAEVDAGAKPGVTTEESAQLKALKRENAELKRANDILKAAALDSTGQGNTLGWSAESQALARAVVELRRDGVEIVLAERRQVRSLGQVLPEELVRVLVGASLPGAPRGREEHVNTRVGGQALVSCQLHAAVPGQRGA